MLSLPAAVLVRALDLLVEANNRFLTAAFNGEVGCAGLGDSTPNDVDDTLFRWLEEEQGFVRTPFLPSVCLLLLVILFPVLTVP